MSGPVLGYVYAVLYREVFTARVVAVCFTEEDANRVVNISARIRAAGHYEVHKEVPLVDIGQAEADGTGRVVDAMTVQLDVRAIALDGKIGGGS